MKAVKELRDSKNALEPISLIDSDGRVDPKEDPKLPEEALIKLYSTMKLVRHVDDRMLKMQRQGRIGFYLTSLGEEATHVGATFALEQKDWVFPCYREPGSLFVRGFPLKDYICQILGNSADLIKGKQMPNHWSARHLNIGSVSSPVGTQIPQAVGFAWAAKIRKDPIVALVYFGEGATSQGDFHVGANFAGVFQAPVILFCRNNQWAISLPGKQQTASRSFAGKASAYGINSAQVDGNDILAVYKVTSEAVKRARRGEGATLIEAITYRIGAHSSSDDPRLYRNESEIEEWTKKDPIKRLRTYLEWKGFWNNKKEEELDNSIISQIALTLSLAESISPPEPATLFEDVYEKKPWHLIEQEETIKNPLKQNNLYSNRSKGDR